MLASHLYTTGPCASGDLVVPDPSPAEADRAIAANTLTPSGVCVSALAYDFNVEGSFTESLTLGPCKVWRPGPFPGSVVTEVPGHGVAILPEDPVERARLLRGEF